jgi:hypothetical protein
MIVIYLIIGMIALYVLYALHNFLRLPTYNKVYNMWQEDVEKVNKANLTIIIMCTISFIMGILTVIMLS